VRLLDKLAKAAKAATKAKDALESAGILGSADGASSARPDAQRQAPDLEGGAYSAAYVELARRCVTNPFELVTREDVARLTGLAVGPPEAWHSDDCVGVEFRAADRTASWVRVDAFPTKPDAQRPADASATWAFVSTETPGPHVPIGGVGEEAFCASGTLVCVRVREQVLVVSGALSDDADLPAVLTALAKTAASRA
jgi:hypothetical protein